MSGGQNEDDLYQEIVDIVYEETTYNRNYQGKVVNITDEFNIGRVQVLIEELGFDTPDQGIWAHPRQQNSMVIPKIGDYVDVYFMNGDSGRIVYSSSASEVQGNIPENWNGIVTDAVIFEQPSNSEMNIKAESGQMIFMNGTEPMVLGDELKADLQKVVDALTQLQSDFSSWTPVANDGGAALKTILASGFLTEVLPTLTQILSTLMKVK